LCASSKSPEVDANETITQTSRERKDMFPGGGGGFWAGYPCRFLGPTTEESGKRNKGGSKEVPGKTMKRGGVSRAEKKRRFIPKSKHQGCRSMSKTREGGGIFPRKELPHSFQKTQKGGNVPDLRGNSLTGKKGRQPRANTARKGDFPKKTVLEIKEKKRRLSNVQKNLTGCALHCEPGPICLSASEQQKEKKIRRKNRDRSGI